MQDKDGREIEIGDYVDIYSRILSSFGQFHYGVVARLDPHAVTTEKVLVVADFDGMPMPLPSSPSALRIIKLSEDEEHSLNKVQRVFNQMTVDLRSA